MVLAEAAALSLSGPLRWLSANYLASILYLTTAVSTPPPPRPLPPPSLSCERTCISFHCLSFCNKPDVTALPRQKKKRWSNAAQQQSAVQKKKAEWSQIKTNWTTLSTDCCGFKWIEQQFNIEFFLGSHFVTTSVIGWGFEDEQITTANIINNIYDIFLHILIKFLFFKFLF